MKFRGSSIPERDSSGKEKVKTIKGEEGPPGLKERGGSTKGRGCSAVLGEELQLSY